jgi:hypothetical protein
MIAVSVAVGSVCADAPAVAAGGQCRSIENVSGGWTAAPVPATPSAPGVGSTPIVATSIVGQGPSVVVATDGVAVFRTADGGCTWKTVFTLGASDYYSASGLAAGYSITNIASGHDGTAADKQSVYLALSPNPMNAFSMVTLFGAALPELFAASHDGGRTFAIVAPQPSLAAPYPVECLGAPLAFFTGPGDAKTVYLWCSGGLAQVAAEQLLSGGKAVLFRSNDGGVSWNIAGVPTVGYGSDAHWLAPGTQKGELWASGYWTSPDASPHQYLATWRSRDGGSTWTRSLVDPKPVTSAMSLSSTGVAVDATPGRGPATIAIYAGNVLYSSSDLGKHWRRLRPVAFTSGSRPAVSSFFLGHSLYVLFAGTLTCRAVPLLVRYAQLSSRPVAIPFPEKWGPSAGWTTDSTSAVAGGLARFCSSAGAVTTAKLLDLRTR